jgi:RNA polymerase sigma-70 factor (ECF subfamily)
MAQDHEIVERCLDGDERAYEELVLRYQDRALRMAIGLVGDSQLAEDAVQDAFVRCFRGLPKLDAGVAFSTWLYQSVVWAARTHARSRRRWVALLGRLGAAPTSGPSYEKSDTRATLLAGVRELPAKLKEVVMLRYYLDLPEAEMATMLECPVGTIKSRTSVALKRLRRVPGLSDLVADSGMGGISNVRT